jgi:hypothetical protein
MEGFDLSKAFDELLKPTDPQEWAALKNRTEAPEPPKAAALEDTTPQAIEPPEPADRKTTKAIDPPNTSEEIDPSERALENTTGAIDPPVAAALQNTTEATEPAEVAALKNTTAATDSSEAAALNNTTESPESPEAATLKNTTEATELNSLDSILPLLPPEGAAWLNGLNRFCRRAVEHDLRVAGTDLFLHQWVHLRDTLERLERDLGPSDTWM